MEMSDAIANGQEAVSEDGEASEGAALLEGEPEGVRQSFGLSPKQRIALEARLAGASQAEAARLAGVHDSTVSRWINDDPKFIAAFNARTLELIKSEHVAAATLLPLANAAVRQSLQAGNGWLGIHYLRYTESIKSQALPTTAKAVREEKKLAQQIHEAELMKKQVQLREQQLEIEKLKEKLDRRDDEKLIEAAKEEGYWYAWAAFYSRWRDEERKEKQRQEQPKPERQYLPGQLEAQEESAKQDRAQRELSDEKYRQIIEEANRRQQQDQEKKQRGLRVKSAEQQAIELHNKGLRADKQGVKERDLPEQAPNEPQLNEESAENQRPAAEQPSSNDPQPTPDSPRLKKPREVDLWEAEHEEANQEAEEWEPEEQEVTEHRPAAEQRPADDSAKSNPDIEPQSVRSEQDPPGDPDERTEGCAKEARENERNGT